MTKVGEQPTTSALSSGPEQVDSGAGAAKRVIEPVKGLRTLTA